MFIEQPPLILRWLYPRAFWRMDKNEKAVYLTFDDGPIPEITPWANDYRVIPNFQLQVLYTMLWYILSKQIQVIVEESHIVLGTL